MKKKISFSGRGQRGSVGEYTIDHMLPNRYADSIGPFVMLDHLLPAKHSPGEPLKTAGTGAHPHRGIATLTYLLSGVGEHYDSYGHHAKVSSGGAQWMKAGNGIIHDEAVNADPATGELLTHGFQFWVNLPSKNKAEQPEYISVDAKEMPLIQLGDKGWLKVVAGEYAGQVSKIPAYLKQYIYHIHLDAGKQFSMETEKDLEYGVFLPLHSAMINGEEFKKGEFLEFDREGGTIEFNNASTDGIDIILFGGEQYKERIVFGGPFVMNNEAELADAYRDFHAGKYGQIDYATKN